MNPTNPSSQTNPYIDEESLEKLCQDPLRCLETQLNPDLCMAYFNAMLDEVKHLADQAEQRFYLVCTISLVTHVSIACTDISDLEQVRNSVDIYRRALLVAYLYGVYDSQVPGAFKRALTERGK